MTQTVAATAQLGPDKTGLAIGLRVLNMDGTVYSAFSTTGVAETSVLGTYRKANGVVVPDAGGTIVWGVSGTDYVESPVDPASPTAAAVGSEVWTGAYTRQINSVSGSVGGKVLGGGSDAITGIGASTQLADGVVHGGTTAELTLKTAVLNNLDNQGIALSLRGGNPASPGHAIALLDENGTLGTGRIRGYIDGVVNGVALAAEAITDAAFDATGLQAVADALKLAPTAGDPATGSVYDALAAIAAMMGSVVSGGDVHLGTLAGYSDDAGGRSNAVSFSDTWDAQYIVPNTAGGNNPPGDFGAIRFTLDTAYDISKPISSVIVRIATAGESSCGVKIELLAAPPPLWGTVWNERSWGTTVFTLTGSGFVPEYHDFDITALFSELLAALPNGSSITAVCIGIYPTGGNSPTIYFTDGGFAPSLIVSEAYVISVATKQSVADALALAPAAGAPAIGSVYDLLVAPASEPAQLDWRAWSTPSGALAALYDTNAIDDLTHSGTTLTAEGDTGFAAWVLQEFDGKLFVGVGKTPLNHIAAVIGSIATAGAAPTFEYALPEEGVSAMTVGSDGKLYVAGADERANTGDSSIYIRTAAGAWTRKQTVTNTQHIFGMCFVGTRLWVAGQGNPDGILYSDDYGDTWNLGGLGPSQRYYDIIALGSALIVQAWDPLPWWPVYRTTNYGGSWNQVVGIESGTGRMVVWQGVIIGVSNTGKLFTVDSSGTGTEYTPPFTPRQTYNNLAVDTDGYLCVLGTTGVWRTNDLANWKQVWSFSPVDTVRSLGTWGDNLVVSTDGATAQVLSRPASPEIAQQQMLRDALKLAASPGTAAAGSIDSDLGAIRLITDAIDTSAVTITSTNNAGVLTFTKGVTFNATVSGLTISATWTKLYFTLKESDYDTDDLALLQLVVTNPGAGTDGLLYLDGSDIASPIVASDGTLAVNQAGGTVVIAITNNATVRLSKASGLVWDIKTKDAAGATVQNATGTASITQSVTQTI